MWGNYIEALLGAARSVGSQRFMEEARISGRRYLRFSPLFKLVNVAERDVWVYVDGRQVETYRDAKGNVLFEVKGMIAGEALVEVTSSIKPAKAK